jgi:23S rRNA maturation-related 3'-5' exoribonuclease YhaM
MNKVDVFKKELSYIKNEKYVECAKNMIELLPDYFFTIPASSTGKYHPEFAQGDGGLVRHTKVAVRMAYELSSNNSIGHSFKNDEKDLMMIALIMHDGAKSGIPKGKYTCVDHPLIISKLIRDNKSSIGLSDEEIDFVCSVIESHMGEWNTDFNGNEVLPLPKNKYQRFVHMCDFLASKKFINVKFSDNEIVG